MLSKQLNPITILDKCLDAIWHTPKFDREGYIIVYNASMRLQGLDKKVKPRQWEPDRWGK